MKELYISPVLNVLCFAPVERLAANDVIDFDALLGTLGSNGATQRPGASLDEEGDLDIDL